MKLPQETGRDTTVDIFRGLTIFAMIFVNDLASVTKIPAWMKHFPADGNGMTFVDIVFPAFLFISGMSIPLALNKKLDGDGERRNAVFTILRRTLSLLVIGVLMVNIGGANAELTGMHKYMWGTLILLCIVFFFNTIFKDKERLIVRLLSVSSALILIYLFRSGTAAEPGWLQTKWWGIIGLIGWAYLCNALLYFWSGNNWKIVAAGLIFFLLLYIGDAGGLFGEGGTSGGIIWIGVQLGSHSLIMCSGLLVSVLLKNFDNPSEKFKKPYLLIIICVAMFLLGWLLDPIYGVNKNAATPAWAFYSVGWCIVLYLLLTLFPKKWFGNPAGVILSLAGSNALLVYILPDIFYFVLNLSGITLWGALGDGLVGILRSTVFAILFVIAAAYLYKINFRLKV